MSLLITTYHAVNAFHDALPRIPSNGSKPRAAALAHLDGRVNSILERYEAKTWSARSDQIDMRNRYVALFTGFIEDGAPLFRHAPVRVSTNIITTVERLSELLEYEKDDLIANAHIAAAATGNRLDTEQIAVDEMSALELEDLRESLAYSLITWQHIREYRSGNALQDLVRHVTRPLPIPDGLDEREEKKEI